MSARQVKDYAGWLVAGFVLVLAPQYWTNAGNLPPTAIGQHTVHYLGTTYDESADTSTAMWAVTDHGCDIASPSLAVMSAGGRGGGGKTNCNSMSHIAFDDFLCNPADLLWPDGRSVALYYTVPPEEVAECSDGSYSCRETVYVPYYGASKPDGPGDWIKYSTYRGTPGTVQLATGFTHVFHVTLRGEYSDGGSAVAAIKSGNTVRKGSVPAPYCAATRR